MISYRFIDRIPAEVIATLPEEERTLYLREEIIIKQEKIYENWKFWALVAAGVAGLSVIISLILCLVKMKRKNDAIIIKVEMMDDKKKF